jgi:anti-sigma factor RsiW
MAELVTDYLEGDLPWHRRVAARLHLFVCSACTHYFDQMRRTIALLRNVPAPVLAKPNEDALIQRLGTTLPPD